MPKTNTLHLVMPRVVSVKKLFISRQYSENFHADAVCIGRKCPSSCFLTI